MLEVDKYRFESHSAISCMSLSKLANFLTTGIFNNNEDK